MMDNVCQLYATALLNHQRPTAELQLRIRARCLGHYNRHALGTILSALEADVVVDEQVGQYKLDLVASKEPAGTSVFASAKINVGVVERSELPAMTSFIGFLAHVIKSQGVELFWVGEKSFIV